MKDLKHDKAYTLRATLLVLLDMFTIQLASFFALYIRYDFKFDDIEEISGFNS